jgi:dephospho-CoA kinase
MKLIIITGMPGAGKSEVAEAFKNASVPVVVMGDVVREETRKRGLEVNHENTKKVMLDLREQDGPGAVAKHCIDTIKETDASVVVIEGCRSIAEIDVFDDYAEKTDIICIHSSPATRFSRLRDRGRDDAPKDWATFRERDLREIGVGLGGVIALSTVMIVNEGSIEELCGAAKALVEEHL